jgi:hypothetical protein
MRCTRKLLIICHNTISWSYCYNLAPPDWGEGDGQVNLEKAGINTQMMGTYPGPCRSLYGLLKISFPNNG